jgi:hypothetical protein
MVWKDSKRCKNKASKRSKIWWQSNKKQKIVKEKEISCISKANEKINKSYVSKRSQKGRGKKKIDWGRNSSQKAINYPTIPKAKQHFYNPKSVSKK